MREYAIGDHHDAEDVMLQIVPVIANHCCVSDHHRLDVVLARIEAASLRTRSRYVITFDLKIDDVALRRFSRSFRALSDLQKWNDGS